MEAKFHTFLTPVQWSQYILAGEEGSGDGERTYSVYVQAQGRSKGTRRRNIIQGVQKVTKRMEKYNINFILLLLCHFLKISAENVHHYALHRDAHDESC
jgi:DNA-dependent RNA polymerase auxiliary subunit epsilon